MIGSLLVGGALRPDELSLGIEPTFDGNAVAADGREVADLFLVGTLRKSTDWESTAVPELRNQAAAAAAERVLALLERGLWPGRRTPAPGRQVDPGWKAQMVLNPSDSQGRQSACESPARCAIAEWKANTPQGQAAPSSTSF